MAATEYKVGDHARLNRKRTGLVRFHGGVEFAEGDWYGVELDDGFEGRNDGSYEGKQYFQCKAGQGVFLQGRNFRGLVGSPPEALKKTLKRQKTKKTVRINSNDEKRPAKRQPRSISDADKRRPTKNKREPSENMEKLKKEITEKDKEISLLKKQVEELQVKRKSTTMKVEAGESSRDIGGGDLSQVVMTPTTIDFKFDFPEEVNTKIQELQKQNLALIDENTLLKQERKQWKNEKEELEDHLLELQNSTEQRDRAKTTILDDGVPFEPNAIESNTTEKEELKPSVIVSDDVSPEPHGRILVITSQLLKAGAGGSKDDFDFHSQITSQQVMQEPGTLLYEANYCPRNRKYTDILIFKDFNAYLTHLRNDQKNPYYADFMAKTTSRKYQMYAQESDIPNLEKIFATLRVEYHVRELNVQRTIRTS